MLCTLGNLLMIEAHNLTFYQPSLDHILDVQSADGSIAWEKGKKLDPWDHVEAAMGLMIGNRQDESEAAFIWLKDNQEEDGSWFAEYKNNGPSSKRKESNFSAYLATGLWHYYLISRNKSFLEAMFPSLEASMDFVIALQTDFGDIQWAKENNHVLGDSLITGCSSIYKSLDCAISIYKVLGLNFEHISKAKKSLQICLLENPERFDRGWKSKSRYSMDWYYPVMCGVVEGEEARERIEKRWHEFIVEGMGCKCVEEEPWVTVAESSELVVALMKIGEHKKAQKLFDCLHQWRDIKDNLYWTGYVYTDKTYWPVEKPTWTAAAVLLAADSIYKFTPGSELFLKEWGEKKNAGISLS